MELIKTVGNLENLDNVELSEFVSHSDICIFSEKNNDRSKNLQKILNEIEADNLPALIDVTTADQGIVKYLGKFIREKSSSNRIKICIDITYIERNEMAEIFSTIADSIQGNISIEIAIIYALAIYNPPTENFTPNDRVSPAHPRFSGWYAKPQFPITAIVGLGYEKDKAIGAIEYIEADSRYLFIPDSSEKEYLASVYEQNSALLEDTSEKDIIIYNVHDPVESIYMLNAIVMETKKCNKPALFPFGPKIFFSSSLIVALMHPEVSVWHVSGEPHDNKYENQETASLISYRFSLAN